MAKVDEAPDGVVRQRAIDYIQGHWGSVGDLPKPLIPVIWVTVYQSLRIAMTAEIEGSPKALLKDQLIGDRQLLPQLEEATARIQFLQKMIPIVRANATQAKKAADAQLAVDVLKWGILDAPVISGLSVRPRTY